MEYGVQQESIASVVNVLKIICSGAVCSTSIIDEIQNVLNYS